MSLSRGGAILDTAFTPRARWVNTRSTVIFPYCTVLILLSLLLGGGTHSGFLNDAILELAAVPLLAFVLWRKRDQIVASQTRQANTLCVAIALLPALQLIPLPPFIWTRLGGHEVILETFEILGDPLPWMPLTVSPRATWLSGLSLIPPLTIFLATLQLGPWERRLMSLAILLIGIVSGFVGLLQVAQGPDSPLRFFEITNPSEAVGFFANRNHFASFLYSLTLLAAAWAVDAGTRKKNSLVEKRVANVTLAIAFVVIVVFFGGRDDGALARWIESYHFGPIRGVRLGRR